MGRLEGYLYTSRRIRRVRRPSTKLRLLVASLVRPPRPSRRQRKPPQSKRSCLVYFASVLVTSSGSPARHFALLSLASADQGAPEADYSSSRGPATPTRRASPPPVGIIFRHSHSQCRNDHLFGQRMRVRSHSSRSWSPREATSTRGARVAGGFALGWAGLG